MFGNDAILSVKDLNQMVKDLLTDAIGQIWLAGEISNFSKPVSGHWYFTLKDDFAQVRCVMFRSNNLKTGLTPQNGKQVLVNASITLYEARGEYQLVINSLQLAGVGLLQQKFARLKQKLQEEGLLDSRHKQPIPKNIQTIGIVTSATGAALHDICQILKRRDPSLHIIIYPSLVQGDEAATKIAKMIEIANQRCECDILIVGRGGGSLEDLWSFNEEIVARAIFNSKLPIISAIGHETDFTIADFTADLRATTPSVAAELVSRDKHDQLKDLNVLSEHLAMAIDHLMLKKHQYLQTVRYRLQSQHPQVKLAKQQTYLLAQGRSLNAAVKQILFTYANQLNQLNNALYRQVPSHKMLSYVQTIKQKQQQLITLIKQHLAQKKHRIAISASQLNTVSPLATLGRGYSITTVASSSADKPKRRIKPLAHLKLGDTMTTTFITKEKFMTKKVTSTIIHIEETDIL